MVSPGLPRRRPGAPGLVAPPSPGPSARVLPPWNAWDWLAILSLLVLPVIVFGRILLVADMVPGIPTGDAPTQWAPWREFAFGGLTRGEFPMWNPYVLCGTPFFAGWQSAMLYPPNFLFAFLPLHWAARLSLIGHLGLAGVAAYLLARYLRMSRMGSLAAALAFSLGAPEFLRVFAGHWGAVCALAWMPLILLALEATVRRQSVGVALLGGLCVAMQLLAGAPQQAAYTWMLGVLYLALRIAMPPAEQRVESRASFAVHSLILGGVTFTFGTILAGVQVVPALTALSVSQRSGAVSPEWAGAFSLNPLHLLNFFAPDFFGNDTAAPYWGFNYVWEMCGYVGVVTLLLAAVGLASSGRRLKWVLAICAAAMLLLALGSYVPPLFALYRALPMMGMLRGTCKFLAPFALAVSLLAGLGFDALRKANRRVILKAAIGCGAVAAVALIAALCLRTSDAGWHAVFDRVTASVRAHQPPVEFDVRAEVAARHTASAGLARSGVLLAICAAVLLRRSSRFVPVTAAAAALLLLSCADLTFFAWHFTRPASGGFDPYVMQPDADTVRFLREHAAHSRVVISSGVTTNEAMRLGLRTPEGLDPNAPQTYHDLFAWATGLPEGVATSRFAITRPSRVWDLSGVRYFCVPQNVSLTAAGMTLAHAGERFAIYENPRAMDRAFIVHQGRLSGDGPETLNEIAFEREVALAEPAAAKAPTGEPMPDRGQVVDGARILVDKPDCVEVDAAMSSEGWLVLTDNFFPGWSAMVNGLPARIVRADHSFRAVQLGPGRHSVVFSYTPSGLEIGLLQSALAAVAGLAWAAVWIILRIRRRAAGS